MTSELTPETARDFMVHALEYATYQAQGVSPLDTAGWRAACERQAAITLLCRLQATCADQRGKASRKLVRIINTM